MNARILIVTGSYPPTRCGIGDYSCNLANVLAANPEIRIGILTSACVGKINNLSRIDFFPIIKRWNFAEILKFIKIIRSWKPDIVHIQYPTQGYGKGFLPWILPMVSFMMNKKVVQTWHEGYGRRNAPQLFLKSIVPGGLILVRPQFKEKLHPLLRWALWKKKPVFIPNASVVPRVDLDEGQKNALRKQYLRGQKRLIVFFGFVYPHKGVELLFEIADPVSDQIIIAGEIDENSSYAQEIKRRASSESWLNKSAITGFLPVMEVAKLLTAADAVILPFRSGGGEWNTSIHGAVLNRAFVITTSLTKSGYEKKRNVYFAKIDDIQEMRLALVNYAGTRREYDVDIDVDEWQKIADEHCLLYKSLLLA